MDLNIVYKDLRKAINNNNNLENNQISEALVNVLNSGLFYSYGNYDEVVGTSENPIPYTAHTEFYIIGSVEEFLKYNEISPVDNYSVYASVDEYLKLAEATTVSGRTNPLFLPSVFNSLDKVMNDEALLDKGIVETAKGEIIINNGVESESTEKPITFSILNRFVKGFSTDVEEYSNFVMALLENTLIINSQYIKNVNGVEYSSYIIKPKYTFKTTAEVGGTNLAYIETSTGYVKFNSNVYTTGEINYGLDNSNGEYTLVACDADGNPSGDITFLVLENNQITHFNGIGLSSLTDLILNNNQLTSFNGNGLSSLIILEVQNNQLTSFNGNGLSTLQTLGLIDNQLTSFDGTGLSNLTSLNLLNNQLTSFNGTGLSNLTFINLHNNQLTSFDASPFINLTYLGLGNNIVDSSDNNSILTQLNTNGIENGTFESTGGRTSASDSDYNSLISKGWTIDVGTIPIPPTFITTSEIGGINNAMVETTTGYVKFNATVYNLNETGGDVYYTLDEPNGEYTVVACDVNGNPSGNVTYLSLNNNGVTEFNGLGLTALNDLRLRFNPITSFDGSELTSLTYLDLGGNGLTSLSGFTLPPNLTYLFLDTNQFTSFNDTELSGLTYLNLGSNPITSYDFTTLSNLTGLDLGGNQLTSLSGFTFPSGLTSIYLNNNQLTSYDFTTLPNLIGLGLENNGLTSLSGFTFPSGLISVYLNNNQFTSFDGTGLSGLTNLFLKNNQLDSADNDSILAQLDDNGVENGYFQSSGGRTSTSDTDYNNLIGKGWLIDVIGTGVA